MRETKRAAATRGLTEASPVTPSRSKMRLTERSTARTVDDEAAAIWSFDHPRAIIASTSS